jgi:hypothetical protein
LTSRCGPSAIATLSQLPTGRVKPWALIRSTGTRGMGAVAGMLLRSVAAKVVHLARAPVTVVK